jgi:hypothetical protein
MSEPLESTPDEPPLDGIGVAERAIKRCEIDIMSYDGSCYPGRPGNPPGGWYMQPIYCEIVCESDATKRQLEKIQNADGTQRHVMITPIGGSPSVPVQAAMAKRFKQMAEAKDWIEKIVVLYFGDSDDKGNEIRMNIVNAMAFATSFII